MRTTLLRYHPLLFLALALALVYHGGLLFAGSFKRTYDAFVHIFFADHYARWWFDHWEPRWYTGFTMTSYPPGSQQLIALLSPVVGLINGFIIVQTFAVIFVTLGIYRFSQVWVSEEAAGYAALLLVFSSSIAETVHVFGQLPTMFSLGFLLNAVPFVYRWLILGKPRDLLVAWLLNAATTAGHHVTTLFGAIFFIAPVIVLALMTALRQPLPDEIGAHPSRITRANLRPLLLRRLRRLLPTALRAAIYAPGLVAALLFVVLPYWLWSRADPITQVSIPHASRDSFILNPNAGLVFWLIPYGITLIALPYIFVKGLSGRAWPMTLALGLLVVLGTGGTTPIPKLLLRGAFDVLTLDRFTFWATITLLPLLGEFVVSLLRGRLARYTREQFGDVTWRVVQLGLAVAYLLISVFSANLTQYRRFQPDPIDPQPIVTFMSKDQHARWRYLGLGFGDQMAWISAQMTASTVDGNYHSARRLPELTSTSIERLEGAKFRGMAGIGSLQQFLAVPEKYQLKYVFSNDQFYDPLLFFSGWHRLQRLENGVVVWEREDIPPLPEVLPRREIPVYQRVLWGVVPISAIASALLAFTSVIWLPYLQLLLPAALLRRLPRPRWRRLRALWQAFDQRLRMGSMLLGSDTSRTHPIQRPLDWLARIPRPKPATPTAKQVRLALLIAIALGGITTAGIRWVQAVRTPEAVVLAYMDDLDFRRFAQAHARLDPETRPSYEQYLLERSVRGGLVESYGKLDSVTVTPVLREADRVVFDVTAAWVTALADYPTREQLTLVRHGAQWYIVPPVSDPTTPPDQFVRQPTVDWLAQGRRQVTTETTAFGDVLDRPVVTVLSARLVRHAGRYSIVGELLNTDVDPADVTVTGIVTDAEGRELTRYNAQYAIMHKLLPKEVTPFRIDIEGVAGTALESPPGDFKPGAFTPPILARPAAGFQVYAKAVVTPRDLDRSLSAQQLRITLDDTGQPQLVGQIRNGGTAEVTIPHLLTTYYDAAGRVLWVDHAYLPSAIRPQRATDFAIPITPLADLELIAAEGPLFGTLGRNLPAPAPDWREQLTLPPGTGFATLRLTAHGFVASSQ